jgi:hypothetical protein
VTLQELNLLWQIESHCERCIRACVYSFAVSGSNSKNLWSFTQNCYAEAAIIHWCKIFGSHSSEPTHFKVFFEKKCIPSSDGTTIDMNSVRNRLRDACGFNEDHYKAFWQDVKDGRDTFFVHNEFSKENRPSFPDLSILQKTCLEMREIIFEVLSSDNSLEDSDFYKNFLDLAQWNRNPKYLRELEQDCMVLSKAIN